MRALLVLLLVLPLAGCGCATYSNRLLFDKRPDKILPLEETDFSSKVNERLPGYARIFGILTTPFKRAGFMGWRDMKTDVVATGVVEQAAWSTDYFVTLDLALGELTADGKPIKLTPPRYLRAEICERRLGLPPSQWPCPGDNVRITGRLLWDGDGFLEVHPQTAAGVEILGTPAVLHPPCYDRRPMSRTATTTTRTTSTTPLAPCR